ncbi:hypothetical protein [Haloplasma contractile]|uniref:Uncharacterized protein n=1 Tax=Haloplasma contractile SSD-17B TaxID=1033810 RepID=F7PVN8_9MOLU|nr:hypothetical protein [Haloplasma contractile]ERJ12792.1 hypothetical protein HLPCO_001132 [Haloplasma contractile SSD-17B]
MIMTIVIENITAVLLMIFLPIIIVTGYVYYAKRQYELGNRVQKRHRYKTKYRSHKKN